MRTYLSLPYEHDTDLPPGEDSEVRTPPALVERFLREFTDPGDRVVDVFAGYGTTLAVAERLDRVPHGIEFEPDRVAHIEDRLEDPGGVRQGSVLDLESAWFPDCECCFTSPPFMEREMTRNPFENYGGESTYGDYLDDIETAFGNLDSVLAPGGTVVVDVCNMKYRDRVTPLAWDVADRVTRVFDFDGEVVVTWEGEGDPGREGRYGYGYDHSYCMVFSKPAD